jgi:hypothetical protein
MDKGATAKLVCQKLLNKMLGKHCDKDRGAAMRICFIKIASPFSL